MPDQVWVVAECREQRASRYLGDGVRVLALVSLVVGLAGGLLTPATRSVPVVAVITGVAAVCAVVLAGSLWRAGSILVAASRPASLAVDDDRVRWAGVMAEPGRLVFTARRHAFRTTGSWIAWAHAPDERPPRMFWPPLRASARTALPSGKPVLGLDPANADQLNRAIVAAAGRFESVDFVGVESVPLDPRVRDGLRPADRCVVTMRWGDRHERFSFDVTNPPETLGLTSTATVGRHRIVADVERPYGAHWRVVIEPRALIAAPAPVAPRRGGAPRPNDTVDANGST